MTSAREEMPWCRVDRTVVVPAGAGGSQWWTFAGLRANASFAAAFETERIKATPDNLMIVVRTDAASLQAGVIDRVRAAAGDTAAATMMERASEGLKFNECLPHDLAVDLLRLRLADRRAVEHVGREGVTYVASAPTGST